MFAGFCIPAVAMACNSTACDTALSAGIRVTVVGGGGASPGVGAAGAPSAETCTATVEIEPSTSDFECYSYEGDCICAGLQETTGSYTVTATLGDEVETAEVKIEEDECGVITEELCFFGAC